MIELVALTRCLKIEKSPRSSLVRLSFHFRGFFRGRKIQSIVAETPLIPDLQEGEDYLVYLVKTEVRDGTVFGEIKLMKNISRMEVSL